MIGWASDRKVDTDNVSKLVKKEMIASSTESRKNAKANSSYHRASNRLQVGSVVLGTFGPRKLRTLPCGKRVNRKDKSQ